MATHRFYEACDLCGARGPEHELFTGACDCCGLDVCPSCVAFVVKAGCCGAPDCSPRDDVSCWPCAIWGLCFEIGEAATAADAESRRCPYCDKVEADWSDPYTQRHHARCTEIAYVSI